MEYNQTYQRYKIQPIDLSAHAIVGREFAKYGNIEVFIEDILSDIDRKLISAKLNINAANLQTITVDVPENWFEAIKERFAPNWLLIRYPVKYLKIKIDLLAVTEKLKQLPKGDNFLTIMCNKPYFLDEE